MRSLRHWKRRQYPIKSIRHSVAFPEGYVLSDIPLFYFAEDIVQETFLKLWQGRSYQDTGKELMYLYVIAR